MHCYHMALNLFQNVDNLWRFAKGCESFVSMAQKGSFCTIVWYNQNSTYLKTKCDLLQPHGRRASATMTTKTLMQTSFVPKLICYSFKFHVELHLKRKIKSDNGHLPTSKSWEEHGVTVQHHVVNLSLQWQYIQNDSLPVLCCNIYIIDPVKWHHHKFLLFVGPQSMRTNRSPLTMEIKAGRIQKSNWKVRIIWLAPSLSWVKTADIKSFFFFLRKMYFWG